MGIKKVEENILDTIQKFVVNRGREKCWLLPHLKKIEANRDNYRSFTKDYFSETGTFQQEKHFVPTPLLV